MSNERFAATLTGNDVAALLRSFDIEPRADSPFGSFEGIASDPAVRTSTNTEPFGEEWSSAISVLAAPSRQVRAIIPGPSETLIQVFYGSRSESDVGLVGCWLEDSGLRVTFPWSEDEVAAITARVVLSTPPPLADGREISLSVGGLEVMAASIDAMRDRLFASMSSRRPAIDHRFDQADVRRQLEMGAGSEDARWLVTLLRILSPSYLGVSSEAITAGSDELVAAGVITNDNGQWRPGQSMIDFATWWRSPLPAVAHEVIETVDGRMQRYDHRITIRGDGPLTQIDYRDLTSDAPSVTISSRDASDFIESLTELLAPAGGAPEWAYVLDPIEVRGLRDTSATVGSLLPGRWYLLLGTQGEWSRVADPDGPLDGWVPAGRVHVQSDAVNTVSSSADAQATGSEPPTSGPNTAASSGGSAGKQE
ncbi:MAG: hypothetical protein M5U23_04505 [Acidimicrobiia bacterium]|nr:hypothetical protein [Acidimicrobiia bacterium]